MAEISKATAVVELGPGRGGFTEQILKSLPPGSKFFALDVNRVFVKHTRKRCPGATIVHGNALDLKDHLIEQGITSCDSIVSGLPFSVFGGAAGKGLAPSKRRSRRAGGSDRTRID
jgi:phospholipid N-methyltransferase